MIDNVTEEIPCHVEIVPWNEWLDHVQSGELQPVVSIQLSVIQIWLLSPAVPCEEIVNSFELLLVHHSSYHLHNEENTRREQRSEVACN